VNLILTYHSNKNAGEQVKEECLASGAKDVFLINLELTDDNSIKDAVQQITSRYSQIDILINNAGRLEYGPLEEMTFEQIDSLIETNLTGLIKLTKECLPYIRTSIINVSSVLGQQGHRRLSLYSASKFGVRGFTQALAGERSDLRVYVVNPSLTATQMGGNKGMDPKIVGQIIMNAALGIYKLKNGTDINPLDYQHGATKGKIRAKLRLVKNIVKK
jgi:short-subunit dehydrogenase